MKNSQEDIRMMKPIVIEEAELAKVDQALLEQKTGGVDTRLLNPDHKIFKVLVDKQALIYIPRGKDGKIIFEKAPQVKFNTIGPYGRTLRLTDGIAGLEQYGISGHTKVNEAIQECYDLSNQLVRNAIISEGGNPDEKMSAEAYRALLVRHAIPDRAINKLKNDNVVFPVVLINTEEDNVAQPIFKDMVIGGQTIKIPEYEVFWMTMTEKRFEENFSPDQIDYIDGDLGGTFLRFSYMLTAADKAEKDQSKRNLAAGKAFRVATREGSTIFGEMHQTVMKVLDKLVEKEGYTKAGIRTSLDEFALYSDETINSLVDQAMVDTRAHLARLRGAAGVNPATAGAAPVAAAAATSTAGATAAPEVTELPNLDLDLI